MRRVLSITLFVLLLLPTFWASLFQTTGETVPVCCRAKGKHHCMMMAELSSKLGSVTGVIGERCPAYPKGTAWSSSQPGTLRPNQSETVPVQAAPSTSLKAETFYRIAWSRSRQKRGPPSFLS